MSIHRTYKTKIGSVTRVIREHTVTGLGNAEHRTSNAELRTSNEDGAAPSSESEIISSVRDDTLLSPPNGERNEVRGLDESQTTTTDEESFPNLNNTSSLPPSPPLHGGEGGGDGVAAAPSGEHRTFNIERRTPNENAGGETSEAETSRLDAVRAPATGRDGALAPSPPVQRAEQITPTIQSTPHVAPLDAARTAQAHRPYPPAASSGSRQREAGAPSKAAPNLITRQELQRELDALRRLIESHK